MEILATQQTIPLGENEGVYVRDTISGKVRLVVGEEMYTLTQDEELWKKELPANVETLLTSGRDRLYDRLEVEKTSNAPSRDRTRAVTFRVPHNAAVQIYDCTENKSRVIFGPDLVTLGPEEQFTQLSLSGGKPKKPNVITSLCLFLGPDFCTDILTVETVDGIRLTLKLSYLWQFDVGDKSPLVVAKLFNVPDFVGELCKFIGSRVSDTVARVHFDNFHQNSARIIREAIFGCDNDGKVGDFLMFPQNNLTITCVDIQDVEPVDQAVRDMLQKSIQLAIENANKAQEEAAARREAERSEREAKDRLEKCA